MHRKGTVPYARIQMSVTVDTNRSALIIDSLVEQAAEYRRFLDQWNQPEMFVDHNLRAKHKRLTKLSLGSWPSPHIYRRPLLSLPTFFNPLSLPYYLPPDTRSVYLLCFLPSSTTSINI